MDLSRIQIPSGAGKRTLPSFFQDWTVLIYILIRWLEEERQDSNTTLEASCSGKQGFPSGASGKDPPANAGDAGLIPCSRISPGVGNGTPLQYSCLKNSMGRGAWRVTVHPLVCPKGQTHPSN